MQVWWWSWKGFPSQQPHPALAAAWGGMRDLVGTASFAFLRVCVSSVCVVSLVCDQGGWRFEFVKLFSVLTTFFLPAYRSCYSHVTFADFSRFHLGVACQFSHDQGLVVISKSNVLEPRKAFIIKRWKGSTQKVDRIGALTGPHTPETTGQR